MPYVVTASKSPERTAVMMFGSAKATRLGTVTPWASWAWAGAKLTCRKARPAIRTGNPEPSPRSLSTY
jgi:hypothetical protein